MDNGPITPPSAGVIGPSVFLLRFRSADSFGRTRPQFGVCTPWSDERVLIDYPTVLPQNGQSCGVAPISKDRQKFLLEVAGKLSLATKHAAQRTGAEFVAASKDSINHDVCSADPWMIGYDFTRGFTTLHPNDAGHAAVADAVIHQLTSPGSAF